MTLNQVLNRIRTIVLAHKQVRSYDQQGLNPEFNNEIKTKYPSVKLLIQAGAISISGGVTSFSFLISFEDLVHVSEDTKENEWDVVSDMVSIAEDIVAQINDSNYQDWKISTDNVLRPFFENDNDLTAGVELTLLVSIIYNQDRCKIPTDVIINPTEMADKLVYDVKYIATGAEGNILTTGGATPMIPEIHGKKVLFITRESSPIYKTSSAPESDEYVWDNNIITLGTVTNPEGSEKFLILYRNY